MKEFLTKEFELKLDEFSLVLNYPTSHQASYESLSTSSIKALYNCKFELSTQALKYTSVIQLKFLTRRLY